MADKKIKINLDETRESLRKGIQDLTEGLQRHGRKLPLSAQLRYYKAILDMSGAHLLLMKVSCDPPDMTIEIPPSSLARKSKSAKSRKKR